MAEEDGRAGAPLALPAVVTLSAEVDISNVVRVRADLQAAIRAGAGVVVVDMCLTQFCDSAGVGALVLARNEAEPCGCDLRFVIPSQRVLRVLSITGVDQVLRIFPGRGAAVTAAAGP